MGLLDLFHRKKKSNLDDMLDDFLKPHDSRPHLYFNINEVTAMYRIALVMMAADKDPNENEIEAIKMELMCFGALYDDQKYQKILNNPNVKNFDDAVNVFTKMPFNKRKYVIGFLADLMESDLVRAEAEKGLLAILARTINHPGNGYAEEKRYWSTCIVDLI